jgi:hypothetical protein
MSNIIHSEVCEESYATRQFVKQILKDQSNMNVNAMTGVVSIMCHIFVCLMGAFNLLCFAVLWTMYTAGASWSMALVGLALLLSWYGYVFLNSWLNEIHIED